MGRRGLSLAGALCLVLVLGIGCDRERGRPADAAPSPPSGAPDAEAPVPPPYARYFSQIAREETLPLGDATERVVILRAVEHALTQSVDSLQPFTVFNDRLEIDGSRWSAHALRRRARVVVKQIGDPELLPLVIQSLLVAQDGRGGEFEDIQRFLVMLTGVDSAPFFVESTPDTRRAAEAFWRGWQERTGPRPFLGLHESLRAQDRWETVQWRAWAADPPSWATLLSKSLMPPFDDTTRAALLGVTHTVLTEDPSRLAARTGLAPAAIARARMRAALLVRLARDTASIPDLIAAVAMPDPELDRNLHDSVFLDMQRTLVMVTAADTAPRYTTGTPTHRELAAAFWRGWWQASGGRVPFPGGIMRQQLARWEVRGRRYDPSEWLDLLGSGSGRDEEVARNLRTLAVDVLALPHDSLVRLAEAERNPEGAAREMRHRAALRLSFDPRREVVSGLIVGLERGRATRSHAEAVEEIEPYYRIQEALVRQTGAIDAPFFPIASRASRDSAAAYWRTRWSAAAGAWRPPSRTRGNAFAARWAANRVVPMLRGDIALWYHALRSLPLGAREVQRAVRPIVLELLALDVQSIQRLLTETVGPRLAAELAFSVTLNALSFPRSYPDVVFVEPLIERLTLDETPREHAARSFEQVQMALVAISGRADAPRYRGAAPESRREARQYWSEWWDANRRGFHALDPAGAVAAVHSWLNRRSR